jgi:hypothetical protein
MKKTFIKKRLFVCIATLLAAASSFAQTITTGAIAPAAVCAGSEISISFTTTGTYVAGNVFTAELSTAAGTFPGTTLATSGVASPLTAVIPPATVAGAAYKVRVVSSNPVAATTTPSAAITVNAIPASPTLPAPPSYVTGASASALTATGTGLLWYTAASGGTGSPTAPTPTTATAGVQNFWVTQTVTGCESARSQLTVTVTACTPPAAPAVAPVSYTVGQTPVALTATGTGLLWYTAASGGTGSPTAPTPTTATAGVQNFWVTQTVTGCESARSQLTVTVTACTPPAAPVVAPVSYTVGQTPVALTATGTGLLWYTAASGGTGSPTAPTPTTATAGVQNFWVTQTVTGCESARAQITVTVTPCTPPAAPVVVNKTYIVGDTPVSLALSVTGANLIWYTAAIGGTGSATPPTISTAAVGTTSYWVTQTVSACESARVKIDVIVNACPVSVAPTITSSLSYCASTVPVTALAATGTAVKWYSALGAPMASAPIPDVNVSITTSYSYFVTQTEAGKCESAQLPVTVNVYKTPVPTVPSATVEYCLKAPADPLVATGTGLKWYNSSTGTSVVSSTPVTTVAGNFIFYVSQTLNGCESERIRVDVIVKALTPLPTVVDPLAVCQDATVTSSVLVNSVTPKTGLLWYAAAAGGTGVATAPTPVTTTSGDKIYYVTQTVNGCESERAPVTLPVTALPATPVIGAVPVEYCKDITGATALTATGTALKWYSSASITTPLSAAPVPSTTTVGTVSYYVTQTVATCESPRAKLDVVTNPLPAALTAVSEALCQEKQSKIYAFSATPGTGNTINWYQTLTGGVKETAAPTYDLVTAGEKTYYVVQATAKGCESPVRVANKLRVKPLPALPAVTSPPAYCQFNTASPLSATPQASAVLNWYGTNASGGTPSDVAPVPSTQTGGTTSYYVGQTLEGCVGDRARIDVTINTTPVPTIATPTVAYCQNAPATALSAQGTNLKWYATSEDPNPRTTALIPFTEKVEDYSFYVTQTGSNTCESPKAEIKIHIKARPTATISGNTSIDLGQSANVTLNFTAEGPWKYVLSNGVTGTSTEPTVNIPVSPVTTTSYSITEVSNSCGNGSPNGSARVTVRIPTITSGNPSVAEACAGKTFTVPFQQSGEYPVGNRFNVQISLVNEDSQFYTIPSVATVNSITATFPDTTRGGNYFVRVVSSGSNPAFLVRGSVSQVGITAVPLPVATLSGSKTILMGESADLKVEFTGRSPWTFSLNNGVKDSLITASSTPYSFMVKPKLTTTYTITSVTNGCGTGKGAGSARIQVDPILGVEPPVTNWLKVYPTVVESKCTVEIENAISTKGAKVEIIDMNGRAVFEQPIRMKNTEVDFTGYPSGLYLLRVQNGNLHSVNRVMKP